MHGGSSRLPRGGAAPRDSEHRQRHRGMQHQLAASCALLGMTVGSLLPLSRGASPVSAKCQAALDQYCNDPHTNGHCLDATEKWYPNASPWYALSGPGCAGLECTATHNCTCTGPSEPQEWRCYSHLALDSERRWSKASPHPNAYCSESYPGLVSLYTKCMGKAPPAPRPLPPPPPPHGYADANVTLIPVLEAGAKAVGCKSPPQGGAAPCTYAAFRIPGFVNAGGVLLAFAEGRATGCGDFSGYHDMVVRRSTDQGLSWGTYDVIVDARDLWKGFTATHGLAVWDPTPLYDNVTGDTFLFFGGPGRTKGHHWDIWMMKSKDKGSTWAAPKNMSSMCGRAGSMGYGLSGDTPSDGAGVQLTTGRLIVPMYAGIPAGRTICYSDDHGEVWKVAHTDGQDATEGEVVELFPEKNEQEKATEAVGSNPTLLYTIRAGACTRAVSTSTDAGLSWGKAEVAPSPMNVDPGCKGGVTRWLGGQALVFANAGTCHGRVDTTVRLSLDNGKTWPHAQLLDTEGGYTTPQMLDDGHIGVMYEKGGCSISLAKVDPAQILKGEVLHS